jgi:O-antigen/teichoic acid export membrane protein
LYTCRVTLDVLGVEDYGVYDVVSGFVAMFSIISSSLSTAISRFLTFEIGTRNIEKLKNVFTTSLLIQIFISVLVILVAETIGLWFIHNKMSIPEGRENAAFWVFQLSVASFCINLISVPYNACIIAHERMKAFAYMSILEALFKLGICYLIIVSVFDKLVTLAVLSTIVALIIRFIYSQYCSRNFEECRTALSFHKDIFKEMFGFAGWSFFNSSSYILNGQGVSMLINVYFGVALNSARGIGIQVETAVSRFVNNFTTAVNPQITKTYAVGQLDEMYKLVCRSAKFSYFIMFFMALPLVSEMNQILNIWLKQVPEYTVVFAQLSLVNGLITCIGNSGLTACMATGKIRNYSLIITSISVLEFMLTWIFFSLGAPVIVAYYIYIVIKLIVLFTRMFLLKSMVGLRCTLYIKEVFLPIIRVTIVSVIPMYLISYFIPASFLRLVFSIMLGCATVAVCALHLGMTKSEKTVVLGKFSELYAKNKEL